MASVRQELNNYIPNNKNMKMISCYVCSPFRGENDYQIERNIELACSIGKWVWEAGMVPIIPHVNSKALFGLHGDNEEVTKFDDALLKCCDVILVCGAPTVGMAHEVKIAKDCGIEIKYLFPKGGEDT